MNKEERLKKYLRKLIVVFTIGAVVITSVMVGLLYLTQKEFTPWLTPKIDVTEVHNLYQDTKNVKRLEDLEQILQGKKVEYTISENMLKTAFFDYNIQNKEEIKMEENEYTENFLSIDNRDTDKVSYSMKYKDNQSIETITLDNFSKVNDKYYMLSNFFGIVIGCILAYIILSLYIIYLDYDLRKRKLGI